MTNEELGELIHIGLAQPEVDERTTVYLDRDPRTNRVIACAWGLAAIGYGIKYENKNPYTVVDDFRTEFENDLVTGLGWQVISTKLGISHELAYDINSDHVSGRMTATEIANKLKDS